MTTTGNGLVEGDTGLTLRTALLGGFIYWLVFMGLTGADQATTNAAVSAQLGSELNEALAEPEGTLGLRFWLINIAMSLIAALLFGLGFSRLGRLTERRVSNSRRSLLRFSPRDEIENGYAYVYYTLVVLVMKATAVFSNLIVLGGGISLPGLIDRGTGMILPKPALLVITIGLSIIFGLIAMFPAAKALARWRMAKERVTG